ncbi:hypothetical protein IFHNHDMJ_03229 [Synechococcus sp. CBW1107]|nr:hypothetical protein IFHNHDMJ_03229 [Synechococcus sp. CBW1107]
MQFIQSRRAIEAIAVSCLGWRSFCHERGLNPKQVARWRQATEDANGPNGPSMADQRDLQRKNQEQAREIRRLQRELN